MPPGIGTGTGIAIGVALGAAFDNVGMGIALGVALGAAVDAISIALSSHNKDENPPAEERRSIPGYPPRARPDAEGESDDEGRQV